MNRKWEKFKQAVMYFSAKEKKKRVLFCERDKYMHLKMISDLDLKLEYINVKANYEYKKNILVLFLILVILAIIKIWRYFDSFLRQIAQFSSSYQGEALEAVKVGFIIALIVIVGITFLIIVLLVMYIKQMYCLHKELLMIEEIRKEYQER